MELVMMKLGKSIGILIKLLKECIDRGYGIFISFDYSKV